MAAAREGGARCGLGLGAEPRSDRQEAGGESSSTPLLPLLHLLSSLQQRRLRNAARAGAQTSPLRRPLVSDVGAIHSEPLESEAVIKSEATPASFPST